MISLPSLIASPLHDLYKKAEIRDCQLLYLFCELTRACNLNCRHCGSDCTTTSGGGELTTTSWLKILEYIAERFSPPPAIVLTGGEPLIHPDFFTIAQKLHALELRWGLVSNGLTFNSKKFDNITRCGVHSVTISIDGTREAHTWLRRNAGSFDSACEAVRMVNASEIVQKDVVTCVNPHNLGQLSDIAELLVNLGVRSWRLFRIFPAGRAKDNDELLLSPAQTRTLLDWIAANRSKYRAVGLGINLSCEGWVPFAIDRTLRDQPFFCRSGVNIASVLCDGTITGCSNNDPQFYQGNIIKDDLAHVWMHRFELLRARKWAKQSSCGSCAHVDKCQGGSIHLWRQTLEKPSFCYLDCLEPSRS